MLNLKDMIKAGIHFGHKTSRWSPKMRPYIWGSRNKIHLINILKTAFLLEHAGAFLKKLTAQGKSVLWLGTKKPAQDIIQRAGTETAMPYVVHRWIGGSLTNFDQVRKAITRLLHLRDVITKSLKNYGKKEQSMILKEVARLEKNIGGIIDLDFPPGAIIVVDARKERSAIKEALCLGIPIIALVDTNTDPSGIPFVIPANDDSPRSIAFIIEYLISCATEGKELHKKAQEVKRAEKEAKKLAEQKKKAERIQASSTELAKPKQKVTGEKVAEKKPTPDVLGKKTEPTTNKQKKIPKSMPTASSLGDEKKELLMKKEEHAKTDNKKSEKQAQNDNKE